MEAPQWEGSAPGQRISTGATFGADRPSLVAGANGNLLISFNRFTTGAGTGVPDPYYSRSTDYGVTWSTPAPIFISPGVDSIQTSLAYSGGVAHAVWVEDIQLVYARESSWPGITQVISSPAFDPGALHPQIVASGSSTLDIVWSEGSASTPAIHHARSTNNGVSWIASTVPATPYNSEHPNLTVDGSGKLHLVWEESLLSSFEIYYSQGTPNGNSVSWSTPIIISSGDTLARRPLVSIRGTTVQVAYTRRVANNQQWIMMTSCSTACTGQSSWAAPINASGQVIGVNSTDPTVLVVDIAQLGVCSFFYFHGTQPVGPPPYNEDEVITGVNSCEGWGGPRDYTTEIGVRSLYPNLAIDSDHIHLAYEQVDQGERQIYARRAELPAVANPTTYLPIISRR